MKAGEGRLKVGASRVALEEWRHGGRADRTAGMQKCRKAHPLPGGPFCHVESGGVLLSHTLPSAVPSALEGLATGFGM